MKLTLLFTLITLSFFVFSDNFTKKLSKLSECQSQCESLVQILKNVTTQNDEIQAGIVNIAVLVSRTSQDIDCILRNLQEVNKNVVIHDIMSSNVIHSHAQPDYLIYFEDFMMDVS